MLSEWTSTTIATLALIALSATAMYAAVLALTRLAGLRSFAQMSAFDFAMSVAVGTTLASTILSASVSLAEGAFALACLYALQVLVGWGRRRSATLKGLVDNQPMMLMDGPEILDRNLAAARVSKTDLYSKLRAANVRNLDQVLAVVMETTGDISVIRADGDERAEFDRTLLLGVVDRDGTPVDQRAR